MINETKFKQGDIVIHKESGKRLKVTRAFTFLFLSNILWFEELKHKAGYYYDVSASSFIKTPTKYKEKLLEYTKDSYILYPKSIRRFINNIKTEYKWKKYVKKVKGN